jgi:hypothetical protein
MSVAANHIDAASSGTPCLGAVVGRGRARRACVRGILGAAVAALVVGLAGAPAIAATKTWDGGGSGNNWSTAANWSGDVVPASTDDVVFAAGSTDKNCTIDTDITVKSISIDTGYDTNGMPGTYGTITTSAGKHIIITGNFSMTVGTTGKFTAPATYMAVGGVFTYAAGTFTATSGSVILTGGATQTHSFGSAVFNDLVINDGLVGYWRLDESSGTTAADASGYGSDLSYINTPTTSSSAPSVMAFADSRSVVMAKASAQNLKLTSEPTVFRSASNWSLAGWFKATSVDSGGCGASGTGSELVSIGNDAVIRVCSQDSSHLTKGVITGILHYASSSWDTCQTTQTFTLNDGLWHHAAVTWDDNDMVVYLDGASTTCNYAAHTTNYTGTTITIGANASNSSYDFDGSIDEVRYYTRTLSSADVATLYAGGQPAPPSPSVQTTGAITVTGNLILASGSLNTGSSAIALTGSWLNHGAIYNGTGTVTLNGTSTGKQILSDGQWMGALTISGSGGAWTMLDPLFVNGALTITAGTLTTSSYTVHAGTLVKTNGAGAVFTPGTGTLLLDSSTSPIITSDTALYNVTYGDPTDVSLVGYWKFDEGTGTSVYDQSGNLHNGTFVNGTLWSTNVPTGVTYNNTGSAQFDGVDDGVSFTVGYQSPISVSAWVKRTGAGPSGPRIMELPYFVIYSSNGDYSLRVSPVSATTNAVYVGGTIPVDSLWHHVVVTYNMAAAPVMYIDGLSQTVTNPTPASGAAVTSGGTGYIGNRSDGARPWAGSIDDVRIYNVVLSQARVSALYAGGYPGHGGAPVYTMQANTTISGTSTVNTGSKQTVYRAYDDAAGAGSIEGYPVTSFSWADYTFHATYVLYNNVNGTTTDKLYKRDTNGNAVAEWTLPGSGGFVGAPKWTHDSGSPGTYYVYVIDAAGNAYKLLDNGASFTQSATYRDGASATATSPLAADTTNIYWSGKNGSGTAMLFRLQQSNFTSVNSTSVARFDAVGTLTVIGGTTFMFFANSTAIYKTQVSGSLGTPTAATSPAWAPGGAVYGRVSAPGSVVYFVDYAGTVFAVNPSTIANTWSYHDNTNHSGCTSGGTCAAKNLFVNNMQNRLYFGDADGHVYAVDTSTHAALTSYPIRPGTTSDAIEAAPLYRSGIIAAGSTTGKVFFIDQKNASNVPALISTFDFGSATSSLSWDLDGSQYMVGTADGKLYYISQITDPTPSND